MWPSHDDYNDDYDDGDASRRRMLMIWMIATQSSVGMDEEGEESDANGLTFKQRLTLASRKAKARPAALLDPSASPWQKLYVSRSDQALITLTGFDHYSFGELERLFTPFYENHTPYALDGSIRVLDRTRNSGCRPRKNRCKRLSCSDPRVD